MSHQSYYRPEVVRVTYRPNYYSNSGRPWYGLKPRVWACQYVRHEARQKHWCSNCGRTILPGSMYWRQKHDGILKLCNPCGRAVAGPIWV